MSGTRSERDRQAPRAGSPSPRAVTPPGAWSGSERRAPAGDESLPASEELYQRFVEDDVAGVSITTPAGEIVMCNPAFAAMFGLGSVEAAIAVEMTSLYERPEDRDEVLAAIRAD